MTNAEQCKTCGGSRWLYQIKAKPPEAVVSRNMHEEMEWVECLNCKSSGLMRGVLCRTCGKSRTATGHACMFCVNQCQAELNAWSKKWNAEIVASASDHPGNVHKKARLRINIRHPKDEDMYRSIFVSDWLDEIVYNGKPTEKE